ncbi:MAG TPA: hypothetical protein VNP94_09750 [Actinomycetota bacterium]|nr:hypothetical protein [Actinomycetota bacterium]
MAQGRIAVDDLVVLVGQVQRAVERIALVLRGEQGVRPGRRPREVEELTRLALVALRPGSVTLELDLAEAQRPFEAVDVGRRAIERLLEGVAVLADGQSPPAGWDAGVLLAVKEVGTLLRRGVERVDLEAPVGGVRRRARLEPQSIEAISRLVREPVRNLRTVEGRLLMADFKETATRCRIHPPMGPPVECTFDEAHRQAVLDALTRYVRVSGEAEVEESTGRIRLLAIADLEILDLVPQGAAVYPFWEPVELDELARIQGVGPVSDPRSLAAPIWESDEELERFLDETHRARRSETA